MPYFSIDDNTANILLYSGIFFCLSVPMIHVAVVYYKKRRIKAAKHLAEMEAFVAERRKQNEEAASIVGKVGE